MSTDTGAETTRIGVIVGGEYDGRFPVYTEREKYLMRSEHDRWEAHYKQVLLERVFLYTLGLVILLGVAGFMGNRYYVRNYLLPEEHKRLERLGNELVVRERELAKLQREAKEARIRYDKRTPTVYVGGLGGGYGSDDGGESILARMDRGKAEKKEAEAAAKQRQEVLDQLKKNERETSELRWEVERARKEVERQRTDAELERMLNRSNDLYSTETTDSAAKGSLAGGSPIFEDPGH